MKYFIILITILISACSTPVPIKQKFPNTPKELVEKCPELEKAAENTISITELLKVVVRNYSLYYTCSAKIDGWNEWYIEQKRIFDQANN